MYAIINGPKTSPTIPKKRSPPIVPIRLRATGRVDFFDSMYGLKRLSIEETKSAP